MLQQQVSKLLTEERFSLGRGFLRLELLAVVRRPLGCRRGECKEVLEEVERVLVNVQAEGEDLCLEASVSILTTEKGMG
jgi:hypothetical protein